MRLRVRRQDPGRPRPTRLMVYEVDDQPGMTVLGALFDIQDRQDGSLAFRYSCRGAVCGACAMLINKVPRLACRTQLGEVLGEDVSNLKTFGPLDEEVEDWDPAAEVLVEPLPNFPVIRDLVVDLTRFFDALESVEPWLVPGTEPPEGLERPMDQEEVERLERLVGCILCALCSGSCPVVGEELEFLGPAALAKARRFQDDPRDVRQDGIIEMLDNDEGLQGCQLVYNCVKVCPKGVAPGGAIRMMKKDAEGLQDFSGGDGR